VAGLSKSEQLRAACQITRWSGQPGACQNCAVKLPEGSRRTVWCSDKCRLTYERQHVWNRARLAARRHANHTCARCGARGEDINLEVNHKVPLVGRGYGESCRHHATNLEVLCHACHVKETNRQRAAGEFQR
jgi:5-methylcytosine-specific restriction endonuclease McrA